VAAPIPRPAPRASAAPVAPVIVPVAPPKPVEKISEPPAPVRAPEPPAPKAEVPAPKIAPGDFWQAFVDTIKRDRGLIVGLVKGGVLVSNDAGVVTIAFPPDQSFAKEMLETHVKFMEEVAQGITGAPVRVKLEVREGVVVAPVVVDNRDPMEIFKDDPKIRRVLEIFDGELQSG
jgi:hypothetical protein